MTDPDMTAAQRAIELQAEVNRLEECLEEAKAKRDAAIQEAYMAGVREYNGWKFWTRNAPRSVDFSKMVLYNPDIADDYTAWYRKTSEVRLSAVMVKAYAQARGMTEEETDKLLGAILVESDKEATAMMGRAKR